MNYKTLENEITTDPQGLGYAGKVAAEIADLLNAETQVEIVDAETDSVVKYLVRSQKWVGIQDSTHDLARNAIALLATRGFDVHMPEANGLFDGLIALGLLNADDKTAIQEFGKKYVSRATQLELPVLKVNDIERVYGNNQ